MQLHSRVRFKTSTLVAQRIMLLITFLGLTFAGPQDTLAQDKTSAEIEFWQSVKDTKDPAELEAYLKSFPKGRFAPLARIRAKKLTGSKKPDKPAEKKGKIVPNQSPRKSAPVRQIYKLLDLFGDVLELVRNDYVEKPNDRELIYGALEGMLRRLDPHTEYINPRRLRGMQKQTTGKIGVVGLEMTMENGVVKVISPNEGSPADRAGIHAGDLITHLDLEKIVGLTLGEVVEKLRGRANTPILLTLVRKGVEVPINVKVVREVVRLIPVNARSEGDVAYIRIATFNKNTTLSLKTAVSILKKKMGKKLKGFIIDLRNNPGGLLDQAISVSDAFLEGGAILYTRGRKVEESQRSNARAGDITDGLKIVVLINGGSAAASEIVAGALQDHKRAIIVGTRSFGRGTIQTIIPLGPNGALRLTTAHFYTPANRLIQAKGIDPNIVVEQKLPEALRGTKYRKRGKSAGSGGFVPKNSKDDTQLQYALRYLRGQVK